MLSQPSVLEADSTPKSTEEKDCHERSTKKIKCDQLQSSTAVDSCDMETEKNNINGCETSGNSNFYELATDPILEVQSEIPLSSNGC